MNDYTRNIVTEVTEQGSKLLKEGANGHCFQNVISIDETVMFMFANRSFVIECPETKEDSFLVYEDVYMGFEENVPKYERHVKKQATALKYMQTLTKK